jgi:hypothetical protein
VRRVRGGARGARVDEQDEGEDEEEALAMYARRLCACTAAGALLPKWRRR